MSNRSASPDTPDTDRPDSAQPDPHLLGPHLPDPSAPDGSSTTAPESDRLARLALNHAVEPADPLIGRLLAHHTPEQVLAAIHADRLADLDPDPTRRERLVDRCTGLRLRLEPGQVEAGIAAAESVGARFIVPDDEDWPRQLDDLGELRPIGIWAVGCWPPNQATTTNSPSPANPPFANPSPSADRTPFVNPTPFANSTPSADLSPLANPAPSAGAGPSPFAAPVPSADPNPWANSALPVGSASLADLTAMVTMVSVVGARACTGYGSYTAGTIGSDLASAGLTVVSGAALGIDAAAHRGALAVDGPTVAVLACGIDRVYPRVHEMLLRAVAERGAVLSELPPGASPTRFRFLHRNRIIAALGVGTLVVEAARRSGSLVTARLAAELGRVVMALPGPVTSDQSVGTHELIRDGATLVTGASEVREACSSLTTASLIAHKRAHETTRPKMRSGADRTGTATGSPARPESSRPTEPGDPIEELVAEALPSARAPAGVDVLTIARTAGLPPDAVFAALGRLAAVGRAVRAGGGWLLAMPE